MKTYSTSWLDRHLLGLRERAKVAGGRLGDLRKYPRGFKEIIILKKFSLSTV
jgi:hypothetical protein